MNVLLKILNLVHFFKQVIEEKHKNGMIPRMLSHSTARDIKLKELEEAKNVEETFTLFHDKGHTTE